ncbi:MAG: U32 family peptidase [Eggerthellaceae bacterium]|nr:U32 family peptidase [Eggerthellaceae bacterium]
MLGSWPRINASADCLSSREGVSELSEAATSEGGALLASIYKEYDPAAESMEKLSEAARSGGSAVSPALSEPRSGEFAGLPSQNDERLASARFGIDSAAGPRVVALATNPQCARAAKRAGAEQLYVPLLNFRRGQAQLEGMRQEDPEQAGYPKQCVPVLPTVDHDPVYAEQGATRETLMPFDLWDYVREGKPVFADNLGDALRALEMGAQVEVGPHVPATNIATLQALADLGVSRVWLSPELTLGQIADLACETPVPLGLTIAGAQELMVTEHCLLMSQGPCNEQCETCPRRSQAHFLRDRKGYDFPVVTDMLGRSHLYNGIELDAVATLPDLVDIGISAVMVDTTLMSKKEAESSVGRAVRALDLAQQERRAVQKRPNTTTGHLFRGVS